MPYIPRLKYVNFVFATAITPSVLINTVATDKGLSTIVLPTTISGEIVGLTAELRIAALEDSSSSDNYLNGTQKVQIDVDVGGYDDVIDISGYLNCFADAIKSGAYFMGSYIPVSSLTAGLTWGQTAQFRWEDAKAAGANLYAYDVQVVLTLLVRF